MAIVLKSPRFLTPYNQIWRLRTVRDQPKRPMQWGEVGAGVRVIQQSLIDLGYRLPASTAQHGSPNGIFGDETKEALRAFQLDQRMPFPLQPTGILDLVTLHRLDQLFRQSGALALPPLPAGSWLTHRVTVAFRPVAMTLPIVPLNELFKIAQFFYGMYGIQLDQEPTISPQLTRSERSKLNPYETYCNPEEQPAKETDSQRVLYSLESRTGSKVLDNISAALRPKIVAHLPVRRSGAGPKSILAYITSNVYAMVNETQISGEIRACAIHRPNDPLVVLSASQVTPWSLAHEVGHVLLGRSFRPIHSPDDGNLMIHATEKLYMPVILNEKQVRAMRESPYCVRIPTRAAPLPLPRPRRSTTNGEIGMPQPASK